MHQVTIHKNYRTQREHSTLCYYNNSLKKVRKVLPASSLPWPQVVCGERIETLAYLIKCWQKPWLLPPGLYLQTLTPM